jgi:hypothetical protein
MAEELPESGLRNFRRAVSGIVTLLDLRGHEFEFLNSPAQNSAIRSPQSAFPVGFGFGAWIGVRT